MNGRKIFREYAQFKKKVAKEFVKIDSEWYNDDILITKDENGVLENTIISYKEMVHWMIKNYKLDDK